MKNNIKNNNNSGEIIIYEGADGDVKFPSFRGVPERRGVFSRVVAPAGQCVFSESGGKHPVIATQCHPSKRGEFEGRGVLKWHELPFNPKLKQRAKELRKAGNLSEVLFWNQVKNKKFLNLDFDRQKIVGNYIVDFYCKNFGVVVEIDGASHNEKQEYDKERDNYLESLGLKIFHIQDIDIKKNLGGVMEFLRNAMPFGHPGITPRRFAPPLYERGIINKKIII